MDSQKTIPKWIRKCSKATRYKLIHMSTASIYPTLRNRNLKTSFINRRWWLVAIIPAFRKQKLGSVRDQPELQRDTYLERQPVTGNEVQ